MKFMMMRRYIVHRPLFHIEERSRKLITELLYFLLLHSQNKLTSWEASQKMKVQFHLIKPIHFSSHTRTHNKKCMEYVRLNAFCSSSDLLLLDPCNFHSAFQPPFRRRVEISATTRPQKSLTRLISLRFWLRSPASKCSPLGWVLDEDGRRKIRSVISQLKFLPRFFPPTT